MIEQQCPEYETDCFLFSPQQALSLLKARFASKSLQQDAISAFHQQLHVSKKNIQGEYSFKSNTSSSSSQGQSNSRVNLTKKIIEELNQIFRVYKGLSENSKKICTLKEIANTINIGYSTLRKKYKEFNESSEISFGKKLIDPPKIYARNRLAYCLIERSIQEGCQFSNAKELSQLIEEKYGLSYSLQALNRALRYLDVRPSKGKKFGPTRQKELIEERSTQQLMTTLVKMKKIMLYFGKYYLRIRDDEEIIIMLLVSRQGAVFRTQKKLDKTLIEILQEMLQEYHNNFYLKYSDLWYLVINYQEIIKQNDDPINNRIAENHLRMSLKHFNPKIIFLPMSLASAFNPTSHIHDQITLTILQSNISAQQAISLIPEWLSSQPENILTTISSFQHSISNRN